MAIHTTDVWIVFVFVTLVNAEVFFVSDSTGTFDQDCGTNTTNPCKSLKFTIHKLTSSMEDVTINILPGFYTGKNNTNITLPSDVQNLTIQNYESQQEVLFSCESDMYTSFIPYDYNKRQQYLTIKGLTIRECKIGIGFNGIQENNFLTAQNVSITGCIIGISLGKGGLSIENSYFGQLNCPKNAPIDCSGVAMSDFYPELSDLYFKSSIFEGTFNGRSINTHYFNQVVLDSVQFINFGGLDFSGYKNNKGSIKNCIFDNSNLKTDSGTTRNLLSLSNHGFWEISNCTFDNSPDNRVYSAIKVDFYGTCVIQDTVIRTYSDFGVYGYSELSIKDSSISNSNTGIYIAPFNEIPYLIENVNFTNCSSNSIELYYAPDSYNKYIFPVTIKNINVHNSGRLYLFAPTLGTMSNSSFSNILGQERAILIKGDGSEWYFENIEVFDTVFPGGINIHDDNAKASFKNCKFTNNEGDNGGAIFFEGSELNIENCDFEQNSANYGGAIYMEDGNCNVKNSSFTSNKATYGSAIYCSSSNIDTDDVTLSNNSNENGGDIYCDGMSVLYIILIVAPVLFFVIILLVVTGTLIWRYKYKIKKSNVINGDDDF